jgi:D-psicose/D-tagatose/L-ribulose 3-epimerase
MNIEEGFVGQAIERCGDRLGYFHVGESHRGYLGTGTVDFAAVFRSLARIGYDGPIAFESFSSAVVDPVLSNVLGVWRNLWSDGYDLARHAKAFMEAQRLAASHATAEAPLE